MEDRSDRIVSSTSLRHGKKVSRARRRLDFHRIIHTEALGAEFIGKLFCYERWIVAFANILFEKSILTPDQLARKMDEVSTRFHSIGDIRTTEVANFLVPTAATKNVFNRIWPPPGRN